MQNTTLKATEFEPVDNTPVEMPTRLRLPQTRVDQMRSFIRSELSRQSQAEGFETIEEADDFDVGEEGELPYTPYELTELEPPAMPEEPTNLPAKPASSERSEPAPGDPAPLSKETTPNAP